MPASPAAAPYLARLDAMAPLVAEHRASFDRDRRLPAPVARALADAGLFRLWLPASLGGGELSPVDFMQVVEAAAALDGSIGWVVGNAGGVARLASALEPAIARDWFAEPRAMLISTTSAVGRAEPVPGGYRVTGRWPYASGIHHATHIVALCAVEGTPDLIMCHLLPGAVTLHDTWNVAGLRGSGSWDYTAEGVFVPACECFNPTQATAFHDNPFLNLPAMSALPITVSVVPLGIAGAAVRDVIGLAGRTRLGTSQALRDRELIQSELGRADAMVRAARAFLAAAITELAPAWQEGGERWLQARVQGRQAYAMAAETALQVLAMLSTAAGAAAIHEADGLERRVRDVHAATRHLAMSPNNFVLAGRVALGLDPGTTRL